MVNNSRKNTAERQTRKGVTSHLSPGYEYSQGTHSTDGNSTVVFEYGWKAESCSIKNSDSRVDGFKSSCCHYCVPRYLISLSSLFHWRTNTYWMLTMCLASGALTVRWNCHSYTSQVGHVNCPNQGLAQRDRVIIIIINQVLWLHSRDTNMSKNKGVCSLGE